MDVSEVLEKVAMLYGGCSRYQDRGRFFLGTGDSASHCIFETSFERAGKYVANWWYEGERPEDKRLRSGVSWLGPENLWPSSQSEVLRRASDVLLGIPLLLDDGIKFIAALGEVKLTQMNNFCLITGNTKLGTFEIQVSTSDWIVREWTIDQSSAVRNCPEETLKRLNAILDYNALDKLEVCSVLRRTCLYENVNLQN